MSVSNSVRSDPWENFVNRFRKENPEFTLGPDGKADFLREESVFCREINKCLASSDTKDKVKVIEMCVVLFEKLRIFSEHAAMRPEFVRTIWAGESGMSDPINTFLSTHMVQDSASSLVQKLGESSQGFEKRIDDIIQEVRDGKWDKENSSRKRKIKCLNNAKDLHGILRQWYEKSGKSGERLYNVIKKLHEEAGKAENHCIRGAIAICAYCIELELIDDCINRDINVLVGINLRPVIENRIVKSLIAAVDFLCDSGKIRFDVKIQLKKIKERFVEIKGVYGVGVYPDHLYCHALDGGRYKEILHGLENLTQSKNE